MHPLHCCKNLGEEKGLCHSVLRFGKISNDDNLHCSAPDKRVKRIKELETTTCNSWLLSQIYGSLLIPHNQGNECKFLHGFTFCPSMRKSQIMQVHHTYERKFSHIPLETSLWRQGSSFVLATTLPHQHCQKSTLTKKWQEGRTPSLQKIKQNFKMEYKNKYSSRKYLQHFLLQ